MLKKLLSKNEKFGYEKVNESELVNVLNKFQDEGKDIFQVINLEMKNTYDYMIVYKY